MTETPEHPPLPTPEEFQSNIQESKFLLASFCDMLSLVQEASRKSAVTLSGPSGPLIIAAAFTIDGYASRIHSIKFSAVGSAIRTVNEYYDHPEVKAARIALSEYDTVEKPERLEGQAIACARFGPTDSPLGVLEINPQEFVDSLRAFLSGLDKVHDAMRPIQTMFTRDSSDR